MLLHLANHPTDCNRRIIFSLTFLRSPKCSSRELSMSPFHIQTQNPLYRNVDSRNWRHRGCKPCPDSRCVNLIQRTRVKHSRTTSPPSNLMIVRRCRYVLDVSVVSNLRGFLVIVTRRCRFAGPVNRFNVVETGWFRVTKDDPWSPRILEQPVRRLDH